MKWYHYFVLGLWGVLIILNVVADKIIAALFGFTSMVLFYMLLHRTDMHTDSIETIKEMCNDYSELSEKYEKLIEENSALRKRYDL